MKSLLTLIAAIITLLPGIAHCATYTWAASTGLFPNQLDPTMTLDNTASPEVPVLSSGTLSLSTDIDSEQMRYLQSGNNIVMPANLEIIANLRYVSGSSTQQGTISPRTHVAIQCITATGTGSVLFIGQDRLFLLNGPDNLGPSVNVDTDTAFHDYRITVNGTSAGSTINVFQDGILVLTGSTFQGGILTGLPPRITWGDQTSAAHGISEWRSFSHNAAAAPTFTPVAANIFNAAWIEWNSTLGTNYQIQSSIDLRKR